MVKQLHPVNFDITNMQLFMDGTNINTEAKYKPQHLSFFV